MDIQREIMPELWEAIQKKYEAENYTDAILDAIYKITNTIRDKTGLESDGQELVGSAFGGNNPLIKVTKMQTDSDKSTQKGVMEMLKGLYGAVRNPRSHDAMADSKEDADSIILFVNYLLKLIDQSKLRFNENEFFERVFDPYYVVEKTYSDLLVQEIPKRKRADIAIQTILQRSNGELYPLESFMSSLMSQLDESELSRVCKVISDELKLANEDTDIKYLLRMCPGQYWLQIDPAVRIRTESIFLKDFLRGSYCKDTKQCGEHGALATWLTTEHLKNFHNIAGWTNYAIQILESDDASQVDYIKTYFWCKICAINRDDITLPLEIYFRKALNLNNPAVIEPFRHIIESDCNHPWWKVFEKELKSHPDIQCYDLPF